MQQGLYTQTRKIMRKPLLFSALLLATLSQGQSFVARAPLPGNGRGEPFTFTIGGNIYVGSGGSENDFYRFEPATNAWTSLGTIPGVTVSRGFAVSFVINDKAYVCLGLDNSSIMLNDLWQYDPTTGDWTQKEDFPGAARMGAFGFASGGKGYVGGGTDFTFLYGDFYSYDPVADHWSPAGNSPLGPTVFSSAFTVEDQGYCIGGGLADGSESIQMYRFNSATQQWSPRASFIGQGREAAAAFVLNGTVFYGTGQKQFTTAFNDMYAYDPNGNSWSSAGSFPGTPRGWTGSCSTGDRAFIGMGWDLGAQLFSDWWEFTPTTGIEEESAKPFSLQPNPAHDHITLSLPTGAISSTCRITDATGRVVLGPVQLLGVTTVYDVESWASGMYLFEVSGEGRRSVQRFLKD
jgi:N-acetylneuraminic acid mutarotase